MADEKDEQLDSFERVARILRDYSKIDPKEREYVRRGQRAIDAKVKGGGDEQS